MWFTDSYDNPSSPLSPVKINEPTEMTILLGGVMWELVWNGLKILLCCSPHISYKIDERRTQKRHDFMLFIGVHNKLLSNSFEFWSTHLQYEVSKSCRCLITRWPRQCIPWPARLLRLHRVQWRLYLSNDLFNRLRLWIYLRWICFRGLE